MANPKAQPELHYWRVFVTYSDGETSGHKVYLDQAKAEKWAERQRKSGVVKKVVVEPFVQKRYRGREKQSHASGGATVVVRPATDD